MVSKIVNSYAEVKEVLNLISDEERKKIPEDILIAIQKKSTDTSNILKYDTNGRLILSKNVKAMLLYLYTEYIIADNEQLKLAISLKTKQNQLIKNKINSIIGQKIVLNDLFEINQEKMENKKEDFSKEIQEKEVLDLAIRKDNIIIKIINKIKLFLKKIET